MQIGARSGLGVFVGTEVFYVFQRAFGGFGGDEIVDAEVVGGEVDAGGEDVVAFQRRAHGLLPGDLGGNVVGCGPCATVGVDWVVAPED